MVGIATNGSQTAGERLWYREQRAAANAYYHLTIVVAGVRQLGNMARYNGR